MTPRVNPEFLPLIEWWEKDGKQYVIGLLIAAVVVGGCAFSGGRGDVFGSVIGAIFMAVLQNGILKYNFPTAVQLIMKGVVIVIMVIFDSVYNSFIQKRIQQAVQNEDTAQTQKGGAAVV